MSDPCPTVACYGDPEAAEHWITGPAWCLSCGGEWTAVLPFSGSEEHLECPHCHERTGTLYDRETSEPM